MRSRTGGSRRRRSRRARRAGDVLPDPKALGPGEAADGEAGLRAARVLQPAVVLLDVNLPDADGFGVAARLMGDPASPAVVLTSSRDGADFGELVARVGARGFVSKFDLCGAALRASLSLVSIQAQPAAGPRGWTAGVAGADEAPRRQLQAVPSARILLVGEDVGRAARAAIEHAGHRVETALDGAAALAALQQEPADLVLAEWRGSAGDVAVTSSPKISPRR